MRISCFARCQYIEPLVKSYNDLLQFFTCPVSLHLFCVYLRASFLKTNAHLLWSGPLCLSRSLNGTSKD